MTEQEKAQLYRGMTPQEIEAHEDWVRRFNASAAGKMAAAERARRGRDTKVTLMTDEEVLAEAVAIVQRGEGLDAGVCFLRASGFERDV